MSDIPSILSLSNLTMSENTLGSAYFGKIEIISLPDSLKAIDAARLLRGDITSISANGMFSIQTEYGEILLRTDTPSPRLENGAVIALNIEAGAPPESITLQSLLMHEREGKSESGNLETPAVQTTLTPKAPLQSIEHYTPAMLLSADSLHIIPYKDKAPPVQPFVLQEDVILPLALSRALLEYDAAKEGTVRLDLLCFEEEQNRGVSLDPSSKIQAITKSVPPVTTPLLYSAEHNATIPFRAIAAQIIGGDEKTRIASMPDMSSIEATSSSQALPPSLRHPMNITIHTITPPQIETQSKNDTHLPENVILNSHPTQSRAVIEGYSPSQGFPVIRLLPPMPVGERYTLDVPTQDLAVGSTISFSFTSLNPEHKIKSSLSVPVIEKPPLLTLGRWPLMEELQQSLSDIAASQGKQVFNTVLPSMNSPSGFAQSVLFFVAALRFGDIENWLGERSIGALKRRGKSDLLSRVQSSFSEISAFDKERRSAPKQWSSLPLPLGWNNEVHRLIIHTRREETDDSSSDPLRKKGGGTRFIVDLTLSRIGPVQMDGLFSQGRLDLILRTQHNFSEAMKLQMRGAYSHALQDTGITGELSFQGDSSEWVHVSFEERRKYSIDI